DLSRKAIPSKLTAVIKNVNARDLKFANFELYPIIKEGSAYKKVKSFSYTVSRGQDSNRFLKRGFDVVSNSVLTSGDWYRFYVEKSGVYRLSKSFLQQLGVNLNGLNPRSIKIYGNGGRMVPHSNAVDYPSDLEENAIQVVGEEDQVFNDQDYILFYAEGTDNWSQENLSHNNLYENKSYYYINVQGGFGKRINPMPSITSNATPITIFDDYQYHELDLVNIGRLGRRWFGEEFSFVNQKSYNFEFPNIVTAEQINFRIVTAVDAPSATSFNVKANGTQIGSLNIAAPANGFDGFYREAQANYQFTASSSIKIDIEFNNGGVPSSKGYLDYIVLMAKRSLQGYGKQFRFQYDAASTMTGFGEFQFSNASTIAQVWDITDIYNVSSFKNENQGSFSFKASLGEVRKYVAVDQQDYYSPLRDSRPKVVNQNIKGTIFKNAQGQFQDIDYLIVTPAFLNTSAEKLANFHRSYSNLNVKVVNLENIYQEFSSGKQDIGAIRNFVKYVYKNASADTKRVKYLNLFGDASFDFKDRIPNNTNMVPIYHALVGSVEGGSSFCSDDFFVLMDDNEGGNVNGTGLDVAVGRMIVSSVQQADEMVNKVIEYYDQKSYGNWRNNLVFIADDPDISKPGDTELQYFQNLEADNVFIQKPFFNVKKILIDSYLQETAAGGDRYPKARTEIFEAFEKGALVFNYLGHGGEDGLAAERIWEKSDGENLNNRYKYPVFITLTCTYSRFDNPYRKTGGEFTYLNPKGGAIAMLTTVRSIGQDEAQKFNPVLSKYLYSFGSNQYVSLGEALRLAKSEKSTNVVVCIGDPALMLAIPKPKVILTKVNDMPITGPIDDLKSLAYVKLSGQVVDENNNLLPNYMGELAVSIFDKNINKNTLRNDFVDALVDIVQGPGGQSTRVYANTLPFVALGETIFRGNASVSNGQFEFGFVVPRDIRVPVGNGRVSFYAKKTGFFENQTGFNSDIKVGGINENAAADNIAPRVKLYMNDESFVSGGITNESPIFLAFLEDENGMNTASGIGHDMVAILDGDENNPYILNDYYETELDDYTKGKLKFPFRNLEKGLHTLTFKGWDVYNNLVTAEIQFIVVGDETLTLTNVLNYPNPFVSYTQFWFTHNRPFEPLDVQVQVMTVTGKVVWTRNQVVNTEGFLSREITWDGKDDFGDKIGKGVYIYKLTVKSTMTNKKTEKFEKLVIL
ncbi:MAG: type IX secretion system sortase PorU, partial [Flavobacterium sp.]